MVLGWNYFIHEEQRFVADAAAHLAANPDHTITERFLDDDHPGGISYVDYTPSGTAQYIREGSDVWAITVSGGVLYLDNGTVNQAAGEGVFLPLSCGTMTGDLILDHDPVASLEAATKQYVDQEVANVASNAQISVKDDDVLVNSGVGTLDFGAAIDVVDQGSGEMLISVDESEFTSVLFLSGGTMTGALVLSGNPSSGLEAATKDYVDTQVANADISVKDNDVVVDSGVGVIDYGFALDVTDEGGGEVRIDVDESEFVTVVNLTDNQTISGQKTFADNVTVEGDLTVNGTTTSINSEELLIEDNCITLNYTVTGSPTEDACLEVERGDQPNAQLYWNESSDQWEIGISGSLSTIIDQTELDSQLSTLSGNLSNEIDNDIATYSGFAEGQFVNESGDTMTGFLTLNADPTAGLHAATKQYVDTQIASGVDAANIEVEDDGVSVGTGIQVLDFGHALDATLSGSEEVRIDVDESEFTSVLFLSGGTMTGFITLHADPTVSGHAANKNYVDEQVAAVQPTVQVDFTPGTDLDTTQNTLALSGASEVNVNGVSTYTVNASNVEINETGYYKVSWNVEGEKTGGASQRRILQTNLNFDGTQVNSSTCAAYVRDATNNHGSCNNSYIVEVTSAGQTVGIRSRQTGSGGGSSVTFALSAGHLLIERLGDN